MTRDEAIAKVRAWWRETPWDDRTVGNFIDGMIALGVLKVDEMVPDRVAAAQAIEGEWVQIGDNPVGWQNYGAISPTSAQEIIGKLLKSGFKITRG